MTTSNVKVFGASKAEKSRKKWPSCETSGANLLKANFRHISKMIFIAGIVYFDEVDKISSARRPYHMANGKDVGGEAVQQALLKMIDSAIVSIRENSKKQKEGPNIDVDTTNILFIFSGAFVGLEKVIKYRLEHEVIITDNVI